MLEEIEDEKGYRYFKNRDGKKQKENPFLITIIKNIKANFGDIKYSTYRCVVKLKKLKHELFTYCIAYRSVLSIIQKHKIGQSSISPKQLRDIVYDIFFATQKAGFFIDNKSFNLDQAVAILTNFFWNIFDSKRIQNISLMEFKLTMLILCELEPLNTFNQIIDAHFEIAKDFNHCITKPRFEEFINIFGKVLSYLGEPLYFDQKVISDMLTEAFADSPGINGICQYNFYKLWTSHQNTKFSTYTNIFLLLIRFKKSESIIHQNECAGCKKFPIVGLRYKCQKCKGLSLCFGCFSKGFTNKRHSLGHRFYELTSNEREHGVMCSILLKFLKMFKRQSTASLNQSFNSTNDLQGNEIGNTKLIEDEHIELLKIDDDMECGTTGHNRQRRGTIRSEIFNNSENLLILQRNLMDKLLSAIENLKTETESFKKMSNENKKIISTDTEFEKYLHCHEQFLCDQVEMLKQIHEATVQSFSSNQNNKTIKSFSTPTKSIFLPSSTPYAVKDNKPKVMVDPILCKSIHGYDLNKSYVAQDEEFSISDISTFFQTKIPTKKVSNGLKKVDLNQSESKIENFKKLFKEVKDIIDDSYSDNIKLARTTEKFSKALDQILEEEEKKRSIETH